MLSQGVKPKYPRSLQSGRYQVLCKLGQGAIGDVYKVSDRDLDGEVIALKLLHQNLLTDENVLRRFRDQVLLARQLSHPNILQVFDFDRDSDDHCFITMEYIDGRSLEDFRKFAKNDKLPFAEVLRILYETAQGLAYAHSLGIIHRDLKPSNILVSFSGILKIADFGFAKGVESSFGLTQSGETIGTPSYMAPEQFGGLDHDQRADVYSFGILAYVLAFGRLPFDRLSYLELGDAHLHTPLPIAFEDGSTETPLWFQDFLKRCCQKDPGARYPSAKELERMLREHLPHSSLHFPAPLSYSFLSDSPGRRRERKVKAKLLGFGLFLFVIGLISLTQTSTRRYIGAVLLLTENAIGVDLGPLKSVLSIHASLTRLNEIPTLFREEDPSRANTYAYLLAGGKADLVDSEGNGLMHYAIQNPNTDVLPLLMDYGIDINRRNDKGETALLRAMRLQAYWAVKALCYYRANPDLCDRSGTCPIHLAVAQHNPGIIETLISCGANASSRNVEGRAVFHEAARFHEARDLEQLLKPRLSGQLDVDVRDPNGLTPLMYATLPNQNPKSIEDTLLVLLENGANLEARDNRGRGPLIHGLLNKNRTAVEFLLAKGASPEGQDSFGMTTRDFAQAAGLQDLHPAWAHH